jgi:hypothetical protein
MILSQRRNEEEEDAKAVVQNVAGIASAECRDDKQAGGGAQREGYGPMALAILNRDGDERGHDAEQSDQEQDNVSCGKDGQVVAPA